MAEQGPRVRAVRVLHLRLPPPVPFVAYVASRWAGIGRYGATVGVFAKLLHTLEKKARVGVQPTVAIQVRCRPTHCAHVRASGVVR